MHQRFNKHYNSASSLLIVGMSLILAIVVLGLAVMNFKRERQYMGKILSEKGASLIRAFEAGARTGMMGAFGTLPRLDTLIKETVDQPDILYITILDSSGEILAHNDSEMVGRRFVSQKEMASLGVSKEVQWRTIGDDSLSAFEVYKLFLQANPKTSQNHMHPMMQQRMKMMSKRMGMQSGPGWLDGKQQAKLLDPDSKPVIVIGMDTSSFQDAINEDIKMTIVISAILLLLGVTGVVSLFWAQNYTRSKKLLSDINAISSEMINNLPEGIILTDSTLNIRFLNKNAETLLGVHMQDIIGHSPEETLPSAITSIEISDFLNNQSLEKEIQIDRPDGHVMPLSIIAIKVVTTDGMFVGNMYILKDLSQIKQLQSEVQKKEKLAVIGNLAAGVAHEVRNPLSSIKGYASYFKTLFVEDSENRAAAEVLVNETERLNRVITELLEIARPSDLKLKEVNLQTVFDTTLRLIQADADQLDNIDIALEISDDLNGIVIDADRIVQVLMNIYLNSIQAMPDGGGLRTKVISDNDDIEIIITDTGTGMNEDTRRQLFNPYFTTKATGTGLGMAIVQKIIEAHKGEISVFSEEGSGTKITICLPKLQ